MTDKIRFLVVLVALTVPWQSVAGKPIYRKKLIPMEPMFDSRGIPPPKVFTLKIKHTQVLLPPDPNVILHGETKVIDLHADEKEVPPLQAGVTETQSGGGNVETLEHGVLAKFHVDLHKLAAQYAPEIARLMDTQIAEARRRSLAEVERQERQMEKELRDRKPQPLAPAVPATAKVKPEESKQLAAELKQANKPGQRLSGNALEAALAQAASAMKANKLPALVLPPQPKIASGQIPLTPGASAVDDAEQQMAQQLAHANARVPVSQAASLSTQMDLALKQSRTEVAQVQPVMDTVLTSMRNVPSMRIPTAQAVDEAAKSDPSSVIAWDAWHAKFAELARNPILAALKKSGGAAGANTVEVTVTAARHIDVRIVQSGDAAFDQAMLEAYRSLEGNAALAFPASSRRTSVSFLIDNKHAGKGVPTGVNSQTSVDDRELVPGRRR